MKATISEVQALIPECNGNIAAIARRLRVSRAYIYKRINEAPALRGAIEDAREAMLDNVESALYKQVLEGNTTAMIFWLKTQGKKRGYVERSEITGADGQVIKVMLKGREDD